jgi:rare lipoprotein A
VAAYLTALVLMVFNAQHPKAEAVASWYGPGLYGNRTSNGTILTPRTWGIAHKSIRLGTRLHICYRSRCTYVRVIDRGPFVAGRDFDLTAAVARHLGFSGVQKIRWRYA